MKWLLMKIIEWILGILANLGSDWAKGKLRTYTVVKEPEKKRLKTIRKKLRKHVKSLKSERVYPLHISTYGRRVEEFLSFVRDHLCDGSETCMLIGTSTILPSEMMKLSLYLTTWLSHAAKARKLHEAGEYKAIRVVGASHEALLKDVKNNASLYDEFFEWCLNTYVEPKVFDGDYASEMRQNAIELQDYMLFGDAFVFGSSNPITNDEIQSKLVIEDDELYRYKVMAQSVVKNSTKILSRDDLNKYLKVKLYGHGKSSI